MNCKTLFFSIILLLALSVKLQAAEIKHMYEVSLPVVSQEADARKAAFEQGLIEVSMRVSGSGLAPTQLDLSQASSLVQQYRYHAMNEQEVSDYLQKHVDAPAPAFKLWMQFDASKLKRLLAENGLPQWGEQRPDVLLWLAVKDGANRYLLRRADQSLIKDALEEAAQARGLPLVWPEYDQDDRALLEYSDLWGQFWEPIKQASKRYNVDAILLGRMQWLQGSWQVDWSLLQDGEMQSWQVNAPALDLVTGSGIGVATDHIASRYAVFSGGFDSAQLLLRIHQLNSVEDYARAASYLASLPPVKQVYASEVQPGQVDFHVELSGNEEDLKRAIALGRVLIPHSGSQPELQLEAQPDSGSVLQTMPTRILAYRLGR
ncbi:MAG TPA: DUF2066 domain-containing protein [Gammaproteobacteria bacterium]